MNAYVDPSVHATALGAAEGHPKPDSRNEIKKIHALIATTALATPAMVCGAGYLYGGINALPVVLPVAIAIYVGAVLNDMLVMNQALRGNTSIATIFLRAMIPIAGTTLASLPVFLWLFAADIDRISEKSRSELVQPLLAATTLKIDADIDRAKSLVNDRTKELADLTKRREAILLDAMPLEKQLQNDAAIAQKRISENSLIVECETTGAKCLESSTGKEGNGPVWKRASSLLSQAQFDLEAASGRLEQLRAEIDAKIAPIDTKVARLTADSSNESVSWAREQLTVMTAHRDKTIGERLRSDPRWVAANAPVGLGERLIILLSIVLPQPVLFILVFAAKAIMTVFELLGISRAYQFAKSSDTRRLTREQLREHDHHAQLEKIRRKTELKGAHILARREIWGLKRELRNAKFFDRKVGFPSFKDAARKAGE